MLSLQGIGFEGIDMCDVEVRHLKVHDEIGKGEWDTQPEEVVEEILGWRHDCRWCNETDMCRGHPQEKRTPTPSFRVIELC